MDNLELRQQIEQDLAAITTDNLEIIAEFIKFIKDRQELHPESSYRPASSHSFLRHAGTWVGDDLEDCIQVVYETRGKIKVNNRVNPFE